jgi:hypothetical protein
MSTIKILVNRSQINAIKPGSILMWDGTVADFEPSPTKLAIDAAVVMGDSVYQNGRKLKLYVESPFAILTQAMNNRIPYGAQYEKRY